MTNKPVQFLAALGVIVAISMVQAQTAEFRGAVGRQQTGGLGLGHQPDLEPHIVRAIRGAIALSTIEEIVDRRAE